MHAQCTTISIRVQSNWLIIMPRLLATCHPSVTKRFRNEDTWKIILSILHKPFPMQTEQINTLSQVFHYSIPHPDDNAHPKSQKDNMKKHHQVCNVFQTHLVTPQHWRYRIHKSGRRKNLFIIDITVATKNLLLELLHVFIPKVGCLAVQGWCTIHYKPLMFTGYGLKRTYLFGSPSKLCKLKSTVWMLYAAVHLSFKMSKHILPEKSTLGW